MPSTTHRMWYSRPNAIGVLLLVTGIFLLGGVSSGGSAAAVPLQQTQTPEPERIISLTDPVPDPRQAGVQWFAPTGHSVRGAFLNYWNKYGGLAQFGYPITEEFVEPVGPENKPYKVQYFERNRFEYHPENAGTEYEVLLGVLGRDFHTQDPPAAALPAPALYFQETGHNLNDPFRSYWEKHGGLFVYGYPITEAFQEKNPIDGRMYLVQYFERARFEYHPENAGTEYEVLLGLLGTQLAKQKRYFDGAYPRFGYSADFSWVAGQMELYAPFCGGPPECGCALFRYDERGARVQLAGNSRTLFDLLEEATKRGPDIVVLGRLAFSTNGCPVASDARDYFFSSVQSNLMP